LYLEGNTVTRIPTDAKLPEPLTLNGLPGRHRNDHMLTLRQYQLAPEVSVRV